ncbi:hypothetical protein VE01_07829 [Pseudogymnoascus verrucosus]|uniref:Uncharacterized protein n=1 Tax=Pseudogymnoascus verrucosus TaxID=342668 RepID=A0A1B8GEF9_9PEZI|nr:uncharacterized protein VE01_07829 [Pseudogymnoascus verrucosus]OBT94219.1 hypothetical protein VE01_07829 [Pseudogymnoascus verrucosus]
MPAPEPQAATGKQASELQQPQSAFAIISSQRCANQPYSAKDMPLAVSTLKRVKARLHSLAASSKLPRKTCTSPEAFATSHLHAQVIPKAPLLKTRVEDRPKAIGACSSEPVVETEASVPAISIPADIKGPIPTTPIPAETQTIDDSPTTLFDVHSTLLGRTATRYAAARAFNLGLPAPDRDELVELCDDIARREKKPGITWSLEGTYVPRGVPRGRVTRFVETGLLEVEAEMSVEAQSEEEGSKDIEKKESFVAQVPLKSGRRRVRGLWKMRKRGRELGTGCQGRLVKV